MIPKIAVITGPTATGKTALGIALAQKFGGEIVSADSMQIYKHMDIGTAKPSAAEMADVAHHMIDIISPFENYSVARYVCDASACISGILERGKLPIVVGGTGLYIDSLVSGRTFSEIGDERLRLEIAARYDNLGGESMLKALGEVDEQSAARLHAHDKKRIVRALEIFELTGLTMSEHNDLTKRAAARYDAAIIALSFEDRADLYDRINRRVDDMLEKGLLAEVKQLLDSGLTREHTALQAIGYKELAGVIVDREPIFEAVERIKMESRRYAKRQLSWFRHHDISRWILWEKEPDVNVGLSFSSDYLETFLGR